MSESILVALITGGLPCSACICQNGWEEVT